MISITILTKNSEKHLRETLSSLKAFPEVLIYDTGSQDQTFAIAAEFPNVRVEKGILTGFGETHNVASSLASYDWILSIDSDEVLTKELQNEILALQLDPKTVYAFPRKNFFNGKWIRWCSWHPDRQFRLYHRKETQFSNAKVHEAIMIEGMQVVLLKNSLIHYSYDSISDFLTKMQRYSTLFAEQNKGKKRSSPLKAVMHGFFSFFKSYVLKWGFLGGREGWIISAYNGHTAYYKYLKLWEENAKQP